MRNRSMRVLPWALAGALSTGVAQPGQAQLQAASAMPSVTLFNSGRVLVRRTVPLGISAGASTYALSFGGFDLASLTPLDPGVTLLRVSADQAWSEDALLRRNVGTSFDLAAGDRPPRRATLLGVDPERWEFADGGVVFGRPGQIIWPRALVPATRVTEVALQSDRARDALRVMYETSGGAWWATYHLFLDAGRIEGIATMTAGDLDLAGAEVQLLAGNIGAMQASPAPMARAMQLAGAYAQKAEVATSEAVGEAHVYTLPSPVTFAAGVQVADPLFAPVAARAERRFTVPGSMSYYGVLQQIGDEQDVPVEISYRLAHAAGTAFGDLPLPAGTVEVFAADKSGRPQLVGMGSIDHTAPGEQVDVATGTAFDVTAKRVQTDYSTSRTGGTNGTPIRTVATATYRVTLQNAKDSAVTVEVREDRAGEWSVVESSVPPVRQSSTRVVFPVTIPVRGTATLSYRVRVVW
ncbi:MAG: DUF4139 domain-containing protein [Gemmatimonadales bacterium]